MIVELEDDMISTRSWKRVIQNEASTSGTTSSKEMIQKLFNELIAMKGQLPKFNNLYQRNF